MNKPDSTTLQEEPQGLLVGIDIGGTFTDVVVFDPATRRIVTAKASSTPGQPAIGFFNGIELAIPDPERRKQVTRVLHGSTIATNTVLEGTGSRIGLLVTAGFRHMLEVGRAYIPGIFTNYMSWIKPERLVPLELVREINERLAVDGSVVKELDSDAAKAEIKDLVDQGVEAFAISLIHSYTNDAHEKQVEGLINEVAPDMFVSRSSEVLPEYREYERTMTTVLNAYVMPATSRYLHAIEKGFADRNLSPEVAIVRSDAGVMSLNAARERPVNTVLSGPAGGVKGASFLAAAAGYPDIVTMDMGGTSTDVCLSTAAEPRIANDTWVAQYPVKIPILDITTIGAGGGSIAHVTNSGSLRVGPRSAGAMPGPACYGRGGTLPTVTDAHLVLGRLPEKLADGALVLDRQASIEAVREHVAKPLGISVEAAAEGIIRIVNANMLGALQVVSVQRGIDPRELTLVPFGGAGPLHSGELARQLGMKSTLVLPTPGVLSALGFLLADITQVFTRTRIGVVGDLDIAAYNSDLQDLVARGTEWLIREGVPEAQRRIEVTVDLRYSGQAFEITLPVSLPLDAAAFTKLASDFHAEHKRRYGFDQNAQVEVVTLRVTMIGMLPKLTVEPLEMAGPESDHAKIDERPIYLEGAFHTASIYDRTKLQPGNQLVGPAVVVQPDCTTLVIVGQKLTIDQYGNMLIEEAA